MDLTKDQPPGIWGETRPLFQRRPRVKIHIPAHPPERGAVPGDLKDRRHRAAHDTAAPRHQKYELRAAGDQIHQPLAVVRVRIAEPHPVRVGRAVQKPQPRRRLGKPSAPLLPGGFRFWTVWQFLLRHGWNTPPYKSPAAYSGSLSSRSVSGTPAMPHPECPPCHFPLSFVTGIRGAPVTASRLDDLRSYGFFMLCRCTHCPHPISLGEFRPVFRQAGMRRP